MFTCLILRLTYLRVGAAMLSGLILRLAYLQVGASMLPGLILRCTHLRVGAAVLSGLIFGSTHLRCCAAKLSSQILGSTDLQGLRGEAGGPRFQQHRFSGIFTVKSFGVVFSRTNRNVRPAATGELWFRLLSAQRSVVPDVAWLQPRA
ncbi:hypothetical protein MTO96_044377 [Rhipicephalus appendiculatus]